MLLYVDPSPDLTCEDEITTTSINDDESIYQKKKQREISYLISWILNNTIE